MSITMEYVTKCLEIEITIIIFVNLSLKCQEYDGKCHKNSRKCKCMLTPLDLLKNIMAKLHGNIMNMFENIMQMSENRNHIKVAK